MSTTTIPAPEAATSSGGAGRRFWLAGLWLAIAAWLPLSLGLAAWDWQDRWHTGGQEARYFLKLWLFWFSACSPLVVAACLLHAAMRPAAWARAVWLAAALPVAAGAWGRLVEPELLRVRETTLAGIPPGAEPVRIALVSDIHWGLFGRDHQLRRLVDRLNGLRVDAVFVAGDWTYEPRRDLAQGLASLNTLRVPVFAVLGNHDTEAPGPRVAHALRQALVANGVRVIEGQRVAWRGWELVGLEDLWGGDPGRQAARLLTGQGERRLVLAHQPDTAALLPAGAAFLLMAGHTHGGQVRLPWLTERVLRGATRYPWWDGFYATPRVPVFVTPGTGMIGLPIRLGVPPTIDVIDLRR